MITTELRRRQAGFIWAGLNAYYIDCQISANPHKDVIDRNMWDKGYRMARKHREGTPNIPGRAPYPFEPCDAMPCRWRYCQKTGTVLEQDTADALSATPRIDLPVTEELLQELGVVTAVAVPLPRLPEKKIPPRKHYPQRRPERKERPNNTGGPIDIKRLERFNQKHRTAA